MMLPIGAHGQPAACALRSCVAWAPRCLFLSRPSLAKIADLERPRRPSQGVRVRRGVGVGAFFCFPPARKAGAEGGWFRADKGGQAEGAPRCAGVPRGGDRAAPPPVRRPARDRAAAAGFSAARERGGAPKEQFARQVIGLLAIELAWLLA